MSTESSSNKPSFWKLPSDDFVESLRDPAQRQRLLRKLRNELWLFIGLLFLSLAVQAFLVLQGRSEMNDFRFIFAIIIIALTISDIRHRRYIVEIYQVLVAKEGSL